MKLKIPMFPFWGYSLGILVFVLLVKFGFISTNAIGISVSSLEVVLIIYALILGLVQVTRQSTRLKKLSAIATDLGSGHMGKRSKDLNFDSIGNLAHAINKMADQVQSSFNDLQEAGKNLEEQNDELHEVLKTEARFGAFLESISSVETNELVKTGLKAFREISNSQTAWLVYFEPFFTSKSTEDGQSGTGLGLSTVYGIMKQHRGWISVKSRPGIGTRFDLFFPVLNEESNAPVA